MSQASVSGSGIPKVESLAQDNEVLVEAGGQVRRASLSSVAEALDPEIQLDKQTITAARDEVLEAEIRVRDDADRSEIAADRAEAAASSIPKTIADYAALDALTGDNVAVVRRTDIDQLYTRVNSGGHINTTGGLSFDVVTGGSKHNILAYGDVGNGENCADVIELAAQAVYDAGGGTLVFPSGVYTVERTVELPLGVSIEGASPIDNLGPTGSQVWGKGTIFQTVTGGTYIDDYAFLCNVSATDTSTWVQQYPNVIVRIGGFTFDSSDSDDGKNGFLFGGTYKFENIRNIGVKTLIAKPHGLYTDGVEVRHIHSVAREDQASYLVVLAGLGDALTIESVAAGYTGHQVGSTKGVYVTNCRGGHVTKLVNGHHYFENCSAMPISGGHHETGSLTLVKCDTPVFGNMFYRTSNGDGKIYVQGDTFGNRAVSLIRDNTFHTIVGWDVGSVMTVDSGDIVFSSAGAAILQNNMRHHTINGLLSKSTNVGAKIETEADGMSNLFNRFSWLLSTENIIVDPAGVNLRHEIPTSSAAFGGISSASVESVSGIDYALGAGTYYYHSMLVIDDTRLIGRVSTSSEVSVSVAATGELPILTLNTGSFTRSSNYCIRVYRGTSSGSYDSYADVHIISGGRIIDDGDTICGQPWLSRTAAPADTFNNSGLSGRGMLSGSNVEVETLASVPNLGDWTAGDLIVKSNPSVAGTTIKNIYRLTSGSTWVNGTDYVREQMTII